MEVTEGLNEGVDGEMGASEAGIAIKFKNTDGKGDGG
jgi:hypothetical protein